jgi:hypothetical protein
MGSISFLLPNPLPAAAEASLKNAFFAVGYEHAPVPTALDIHDSRLIATWSLSESRYLFIPWPVGPFGTLVAATPTICERTEPYRLMIELARGKLHQVRTQVAEWQSIGLQTPTGFDQTLVDATRCFGRALRAEPSDSDILALRVLEQSYVLGDILVREFIEQLLDTRHQQEGPLDTRLSARTLSGPGEYASDYARSFNAAQIGIRWCDIEPEESHYDWTATDAAVAAAKAADQPITIGPVIDLAPGMLPSWAAGWEGDLPTLAAFMCDFLETVVARYKADVRRWVVCAGFNHSNALGLDDDERLRLAFRLFEAAGQVDPALELVVNVTQPWGDYLTNEDHTISPLTFPDDLIRTGLKVSGIELELRAGVSPRGSLPRDLLDTARVINLFSVLGLPLELVLSLPSSSEPDSLANKHGQSVWAPAWRAGPSLEGQAEWGASFAALGICTPHVRAVTWDHWADAEAHLTPAGGLVDSAGQPKPLLARLRTLRSAHLH